jgi:hypothetical protein
MQSPKKEEYHLKKGSHPFIKEKGQRAFNKENVIKKL